MMLISKSFILDNSWLKDLGHRRPKPEQDVLITDDTGK